ncbi:MAG: hypothetical protein ABIS47_10745 [Acidimicrobiales bacterium]
MQRFYTGMALVAASASTLLSAGELLGRDHRLAETSVLVTVIVLGLVTVGWLGEKFARRWGVLAGELVAWIAEARLRERRRGG